MHHNAGNCICFSQNCLGEKKQQTHPLVPAYFKLAINCKTAVTDCDV